MHLKVVIKLKASKFHLCLILILAFFSVLFLIFFETSTIKNIFLYSVLFHSLFSVCVVYSFFEISLLHEKQGSKLNLSKDKLSIH